MRGGARKCSKCIHGPTQRECDVPESERDMAILNGFDPVCSHMEREPIASRVKSAAKRFASEWPERKAMRGRR